MNLHSHFFNTSLNQVVSSLKRLLRLAIETLAISLQFLFRLPLLPPEWRLKSKSRGKRIDWQVQIVLMIAIAVRGYHPRPLDSLALSTFSRRLQTFFAFCFTCVSECFHSQIKVEEMDS